MTVYAELDGPKNSARPSHPKPSILVVDDDETILDLIEDLLCSDYTVFRATRGEEALDYLNCFSCNLMLLDLGMPGMDGLDVIREVRANSRWQNTPIIVMSAFPELRNLVPPGAVQATIDKPFNISRLMATVEQVLALRR